MYLFIFTARWKIGLVLGHLLRYLYTTIVQQAVEVFTTLINVLYFRKTLKIKRQKEKLSKYGKLQVQNL